MNDYRLYFLNQEEHIVRRLEFQFESDEAATAHAKQFVDGRALELWQGARKVIRLEAK